MNKVKEYTGPSFGCYYVMVRVPDGHYFLHSTHSGFDEAYQSRCAAVKLYMVSDRDVEIVKPVDWVEVKESESEEDTSTITDRVNAVQCNLRRSVKNHDKRHHLPAKQ